MVNVLGRELPRQLPNECKWIESSDDEWESVEIKEYALRACALWVMWVGTEHFRPNNIVTRAQFGTILSRILWWDTYNQEDTEDTPYYETHLNALKEHSIMTQIENPMEWIELRKWIWIMLMRSDKNNK